MQILPSRTVLRRLTTLVAVLSAVLPRLALAQDAATETLIEMKAIAGLRYDLPRFLVAPGARVRLTLENADDMAHNLLILAPGSRTEVVMAAMTMPVTPTQDFVPKTDKVLWTIPVLTPGKKGEVTFTAPATEGVYPYVCSYPGHGFVMFGAMYVSKKTTLPPLAKDANVPDSAKDNSGAALHAFEQKPPYFYRMFMRDSGPASIAVALPNQQNYVWDAGSCRLRYAWSGGFVNPLGHWSGNGDAFAEVTGRVYWRAPEASAAAGSFAAQSGLTDNTPSPAFPLRFGSSAKVPAKVQFLGYRLVERYPEFRYEVDGVEVRELIKSQHHGGLEQTFVIARAKESVFYVSDPEGGAKFASAAGEFKGGVLEVSAEKAKRFTVSITEIAGREPLAYWSMNDTLTDKKPLPVPGVKGRAIQFDGKKSKFATGIKTDALQNGGTIALWAKATKPGAKNQVFVGAGDTTTQFAIGSNLGGTGLGVVATLNGVTSGATTGQAVDGAWHHLAVTISGEGIAFYVDGASWGKVPSGLTGSALPAGAELFLGSGGTTGFAAATLDEVRIYDRVLTGAEIKTISDRERASLPPQP